MIVISCLYLFGIVMHERDLHRDLYRDFIENTMHFGVSEHI